MRLRSKRGDPKPPYLHSPVTASVRFLGFHGYGCLVWGWLSLLPVLIAAGFCERAGGSKGRAAPA
jgi:hypothetical protein